MKMKEFGPPGGYASLEIPGIRQPERGRQPSILLQFVETFMKMKTIGPRGGGSVQNFTM